MPRYMTQVAYTPQALAALTKNPENRGQVFGALLEKHGCRLTSFDFCFGEYDVVALFEAPDETTATAVILNAIAPGHVKATKTTPLLSVEQAMEAMRKAGSQTYRAPGQ